ncbi:MAG: hypothetical protein AAFQ82_22535 [Myxococcota bacterium]
MVRAMGLGKKIAVGVGGFFAVALAGVAITIAAVSEERPTGSTGPEARALADQMGKAVNLEAWKKIGAVEWTFAGRRSHLWDRTRSLTRMRQGDLEVWLDLSTQKGIAKQAGQKLSGTALKEALESCYAAWVNDAFWLNPVGKMYDAGVDLSLVETKDAGKAVLASYTSGGLTPGDAYLWFPGEDGKPVRWKMWTSNIPVGGAESSWDGWIELATGAWISTKHEMEAFTLELTDVRGASTLVELSGEDVFEELLQTSGT